jgi:hypothetical protein
VVLVCHGLCIPALICCSLICCFLKLGSAAIEPYSHVASYHDSTQQAAFLLMAVDKSYGLPQMFAFWEFSDVWMDVCLVHRDAE